jgi:outer membrane receptor protein involved in Fe transport
VTVAGSSVQLRGLGNGYTRLLLDGERAPAGFTIDSIAPETIERIEILRAANADMSTQASAGSINIVQKRTVSKAQREPVCAVAGRTDDQTAPGSVQLPAAGLDIR